MACVIGLVLLYIREGGSVCLDGIPRMMHGVRVRVHGGRLHARGGVRGVVASR